MQIQDLVGIVSLKILDIYNSTLNHLIETNAKSVVDWNFIIQLGYAVYQNFVRMFSECSEAIWCHG